MYYSWRWSISEEYYKSPRKQNPIAQQQPQTLDSDTFFIQEQNIFSRNQQHSKREEIDDKMSDRQMIVQRGVNPFMNSSYVTDVVARDMFLKPINTNKD